MLPLVVVSALIEHHGKYLFIKQDKPGGAYPNTLHLPGGRVDPGETPLEAIKREIKEEVGIEITNIKPADFDWDTIPYKGKDTSFVFLRFTARLGKGTPVAGSDATEVVWVAREDLANQTHNPPTLRLLARLNLMSN